MKCLHGNPLGFDCDQCHAEELLAAKDAEIAALKDKEDVLIEHINKCDKENAASEAEIDRLREGLGEYAKPENWYACHDGPATFVWVPGGDPADFARKLLEEKP
jgi:hypothetical protein